MFDQVYLPGIPLWLVWPIIYLYGTLLKVRISLTES